MRRLPVGRSSYLARKASANRGMSSGRSRKGGRCSQPPANTVVKIFAKRLALHHAVQVLVGGRDEAQVHLGALAAAPPGRKLALLQHPQQFALQLQGQVADFV